MALLERRNQPAGKTSLDRPTTYQSCETFHPWTGETPYFCLSFYIKPASCETDCCDWPITNRLEESLSEWESGQMYLPEKTKHELSKSICFSAFNESGALWRWCSDRTLVHNNAAVLRPTLCVVWFIRSRLPLWRRLVAATLINGPLSALDVIPAPQEAKVVNGSALKFLPTLK